MSIVSDYKSIGAAYHALSFGFLPRHEPAPTPVVGTFDEQIKPLSAAIDTLYEDNSPKPWTRTSGSSDADIRKVIDDVRAFYRAKVKNLNPLLFSATKSKPGEAKVVLSNGAETWMMFAKRVFERYFMWADKWANNEDFFDQDTGLTLDRDMLDAELTRIEIAGLHGVKCHPNARNLRVKIVQWVLRYQAHNKGRMPEWDANVTAAQLVRAHTNAQYREHEAFKAAEIQNKIDVRAIIDRVKAAEPTPRVEESIHDPEDHRTPDEMNASVRSIIDRIRMGQHHRVDTGDSIA